MSTLQQGERVKEKRLIQSVARALSILNCLQEGGAMQIGELSGQLGIDKGTVHHLLVTLTEMDYVRQNPDTRAYSVGFQAFKVGYAYMGELDLVKVARVHLERLNDLSRETVHLGELAGGDILYLDKIESPMSITMRSRIGVTRPAYCTGVGKILMAFLPDEKLRSMMERLELKPHTENTIVDRDLFLENLAECRKRGYAIDDEEIEEGLFCVAVPIFNIENRAIAALSVSLPKYRLKDRLEDLIGMTLETGKRISAEMGQSFSE